MRIHLAALAATSLFVLAAPRPESEQALRQGIPLGDLVRPVAPTERNTAITQFTPPSSSST
ncbi:MAG: hypothetical protein LC659_05630, partial [Myxococcales bacterium]|nr:hypothetical protein [Myxococcales bacterium]